MIYKYKDINGLENEAKMMEIWKKFSIVNLYKQFIFSGKKQLITFYLLCCSLVIYPLYPFVIHTLNQQWDLFLLIFWVASSLGLFLKLQSMYEKNNEEKFAVFYKKYPGTAKSLKYNHMNIKLFNIIHELKSNGHLNSQFILDAYRGCELFLEKKDMLSWRIISWHNIILVLVSLPIADFFKQEGLFNNIDVATLLVIIYVIGFCLLTFLGSLFYTNWEYQQRKKIKYLLILIESLGLSELSE